MAKDKVFLEDDQLDAVGGGTILPYEVKAGDTLDKIAAQYGVTVNDLMKWNNIQNSGMIMAGQKLQVKF